MCCYKVLVIFFGLLLFVCKISLDIFVCWGDFMLNFVLLINVIEIIEFVCGMVIVVNLN